MHVPMHTPITATVSVFLHRHRLQTFFNSERDCEYPFNSAKKRSSVLITNPDGSVRLYSKGASETSE